MFNQVSANIAAQQQADLFGDDSSGFALAAQDAKGNSVAAEAEALDPAYLAIVAEYEAQGLSQSAAREAADADMLDNFDWVGSRHHY